MFYFLSIGLAPIYENQFSPNRIEKEHFLEWDDQNKLNIKRNLVSALLYLSLYILVNANVKLIYD